MEKIKYELRQEIAKCVIELLKTPKSCGYYATVNGTLKGLRKALRIVEGS